MKPFELRLAEQHSREARHVRNLRVFCDDPSRFNRLEPEDQALIIKQLELMTDLVSVLEARMKRLNIPI